MTALHTVQTIAKVFKIIATVLMIVCFVSAGLSLIISVLLFLVKDSKAINDIIKDISESLTVKQAGVFTACSAISCIASGIVCIYARKYLVKELADGTPFTKQGAQEFLYLGVRMLAFPGGAALISSIVFSFADITQSPLFGFEASGGIAFILLSFVFRYGAELEEKCNGEVKNDFPTE